MHWKFARICLPNHSLHNKTLCVRINGFPLVLCSCIMFLAKPINVGWGKKETQFHGSEGKEAAKAKKPDVSAYT